MSSINAFLQSIQPAQNPDSIAFFDFDGTLIAGYSAFAIMQEQYRTGVISRQDLAAALLGIVNHQCGLIDDQTLMEIASSHLAGSAIEDFESLCSTVYEKQLFKRIYPEARSIIKRHREQGYQIAIVSSAPRQAIARAAEELGIDKILSTEYRNENGIFTGEVAMPICWGFGKRLAVEKLIGGSATKLDDCYFYSDGYEDLPLLEKIGHPVCVNAGSRLQAHAAEQNWPSLEFRSRKRGLSEIVRTVSVYGSLIGSYVGGLGVLGKTGDQSTARRYMLTRFTDWVFGSLGMEIELINGHYLDEAPPCVVIFNHQSQADGFIMLKLLKQNFAAIGKRAFGNIPLLSQAYTFAGVIPIDRDNSADAIQRMQPLINAICEEGRSVAIAPEGTRSNSIKPGPFKKGAFHLALDAGANILPIVIHNSVDAQAKGDPLFHPARIKVEILPLIDTSRWQRKNLNDHIAQVRNTYLRALGFDEEPLPGIKSNADASVTKKDARSVSP
ncbi:HAD-IB family hydrolase [Spongiibacter sp. UBA1325]|jgi:putative phosphoserine phosphatase/1-acylglycerol-3-phosphate O-acyltransferase|uniref:HAD-IB family hydrolase n=1 Tax=Spongiibacter sp. UBA1325 TaxID=1947543 RepID=UPI00257C95CD|nr:HAD-IB family hydrolase [Spongiibacter sp. UBA1325]|tara:strand:- start:23479 stop:24975 length:1497 start_codon:yes stop_codon:yes gene_type:complete